MNDVGKTALLEALFLHCGAWNVELIYRLNEWFKARRFGDDYYLYVVLNAATDPQLYIIQNPAARLQPEEWVEVRYRVPLEAVLQQGEVAKVGKN